MARNSAESDRLVAVFGTNRGNRPSLDQRGSGGELRCPLDAA